LIFNAIEVINFLHRHQNYIVGGPPYLDHSYATNDLLVTLPISSK